MRGLKTILILAGWICLAGPASAEETLLEKIGRDITEIRLANGMTFIILERHEAPVVSFVTQVDVGSVNEITGATGLAHFFEHMAFKGTPEIGTRDWAPEQKILDQLDATFRDILAEKRRVGPPDEVKLKALQDKMAQLQQEAGKFVVNNEFYNLIEKNGGVGTNAGTSKDATVYIVNLPSNKVELWAWLESERLSRPVMREFYREKEVIMEERRQRTESNPLGRLVEEILTTAFKAHPYGTPVVGHMSDLASLGAWDARAFHQRYYVGRNMVVGIVGDVFPNEIRPILEKYFAAIPAGEKAGRLLTVEPPQNCEKRITIEDPSQPLLTLSFHKPDILHPDSRVYDVIQDILAGGKSSRLYRKLVKEDKSALMVGAFPGLPGTKYPNLFIFFGFPNADHTNAEIEKTIMAELDRLKTEPVSDDELNSVQTRALADLYEKLLSNGGMALQLANYETQTGSWRNLFLDIEKLKQVSKADIQRVAGECFLRSNLTVGSIVHVDAAAEPPQAH